MCFQGVSLSSWQVGAGRLWEASVSPHLDVLMAAWVSPSTVTGFPHSKHSERKQVKSIYCNLALEMSHHHLSVSYGHTDQPWCNVGESYTKCEYQEVRVVGGLLEAGVHTVKSDLGLEGESVREEVRLRETGREAEINMVGLEAVHRLAWNREPRSESTEQQGRDRTVEDHDGQTRTVGSLKGSHQKFCSKEMTGSRWGNSASYYLGALNGPLQFCRWVAIPVKWA